MYIRFTVILKHCVDKRRVTIFRYIVVTIFSAISPKKLQSGHGFKFGSIVDSNYLHLEAESVFDEILAFGIFFPELVDNCRDWFIYLRNIGLFINMFK